MRSSTRKRVAVIGSVGVPARYGGFETLAEQLVMHLSGRFDLTVYCSSRMSEQRPAEYEGAQLEYVPLSANGIQSIPYDMWSVLHAVSTHDVLLVLGVSGAAILPLIKRLGRRCPRIVVNVDGIEWKRAKWGRAAKITLKALEAMAVRSASAVVADNQVIARDLMSRYGVESEVIAYGGDHVVPQPLNLADREALGLPSGKYAFTVCRVEPENNLHLILEAFSLQATLPLVIVGNWNRSEYGRALRTQFDRHSHLMLLDPIYEPTRLNALRSNCHLYVHGHSAGGTNPSLVEAMHLGLPLFCYGVDYNRETTSDAALYFKSSQQLARLLQTTPERALLDLGKGMRKVAEARYRWSPIADAYAEVFVSPG